MRDRYPGAPALIGRGAPMTDYCENRIEIEGDAADVSAFRAACINGSGSIDFAAILPMPEIVRGTHEGGATDLDAMQSSAPRR